MISVLKRENKTGNVLDGWEIGGCPSSWMDGRGQGREWEVMEGKGKVRSDVWERTGKGPSFGGRTVPNIEAGRSYPQTVREALEGKRGEGEWEEGKEAKQARMHMVESLHLVVIFCLVRYRI